MLLKSFTLAAALLVAAPSFAGGAASAPAASVSKASAAPAAAASSQPPAAEGGSCSACGAPGGGGTCAAPQPGTASQMSDEEWKAHVAKQFAAAQEEQPEPPDPDPFSFSVYRGLRPEPMGEQTIINGAKMNIATLIVDDAPAVVEKAYFETFERMGFRPLVGNVPHSPGVRYLSFRPTSSKNLKTVTLVPNRTGTVILASVGNPENILIQKPQLPDGLPVPANAQAASSIQQMEPGATSRTAFFLVKDASPESVREFYRKQLPQHGYAPMGGSAQQDSETYEKNGGLLTLTAKSHTEPNTVAVSLVWLQ
ncbi:hypothetical protein [Hyalangium minutum]|uniref:Lipoprotein n=1 Tax=Hyalangium minutum TaxID=394096 RepID=A0A085WFK3_9BACT|nr:hypothetical protein [Hyalangium minutum]KFE66466.1 hypothetical protein DB31_0939 [Hyalangium minutum]